MKEELVRKAVEFTNGPPDAPDEELAEVFHRDVELDFSARVFNPKVYRGFAGLREFRAEAHEIWDEVTVAVEELVEDGDQILVRARVRSRGRGSGVEIDTRGSWVWTVRDGRLRHYRLLPDDQSGM